MSDIDQMRRDRIELGAAQKESALAMTGFATRWGQPHPDVPCARRHGAITRAIARLDAEIAEAERGAAELEATLLAHKVGFEGLLDASKHESQYQRARAETAERERDEARRERDARPAISSVDATALINVLTEDIVQPDLGWFGSIVDTLRKFARGAR